jgi:5-aminolevulinate synthase
VTYQDIFERQVNQLRSENRYRYFIELERISGRHPYALWNHPDGAREVIIWCSNDYLGMGQSQNAIEAMRTAVSEHGTGAGGTRNISGTSSSIVKLEDELAALMVKNVLLSLHQVMLQTKLALQRLSPCLMIRSSYLIR